MSQKSKSSTTRRKYASQDATRRYWFITWNNPPEDWKAAMHTLGANWGIGQLEKGSTGTPHIQALLHFSKRLRNSYWEGKHVWSRAISGAEVQNSIAYVTKEESRVEGPHEFGKRPLQAKSNRPPRKTRDWEAALEFCKTGRIKEIEASILIPYVGNCQKITHLFKESTGTPGTPRGIWIYGSPGTGKSYYARNNYPEAFIKAQNKWWDGYNGQLYVILDDLDRLGSCLGHYLKIWLDEYPFDAEIKGGTTPTNYSQFIITSNYLPGELFEDNVMVEAIKRRCRFIHFFAKQAWNTGIEYGELPKAAEDEYINYFDMFVNNS